MTVCIWSLQCTYDFFSTFMMSFSFQWLCETFQVKDEAVKHWFKPYNSPLGNSNYHRVTGTDNNPAHDHATDSTYKRKFS